MSGATLLTRRPNPVVKDDGSARAEIERSADWLSARLGGKPEDYSSKMLIDPNAKDAATMSRTSTYGNTATSSTTYQTYGSDSSPDSQYDCQPDNQPE